MLRNYTITPDKSGYSFNPVSKSITVSDTDEERVNFYATEEIYTYSISGVIGGDIQSGVTIILSAFGVRNKDNVRGFIL